MLIKQNSSIIYLAGFLISISVLMSICNLVLVDKNAKKNMYALRYEEPDIIDVIFLGNSHANNAFLPMDLWENYGYTAYNFSQMSQTFPLVYYSAEDAIKMQHPRLIVVDLFAATSYGNDFDNMHLTVDNLTYATKMKAISEFVTEDKKLEYYLPLYLYHDRWDELEIKDFIPFFLRYSPDRNPRKGATFVSDWKECIFPLEAIQCAYSDDETVLSEETIYWYCRLKNLCYENGTLLLFVVVPYEQPIGGTEESTIENIRLFNATEKWCEENNVGYLNLFRNLDEMRFDFATDMQDESHVNILGAQKVTCEVGRYIGNHYNVQDCRNNPNISVKWNDIYNDYLVEKGNAENACWKAIKNGSR